ncbi:MAG: threonine-phosphate decarboxylase [Defluviimonas sp.]|uniref:threonine-phosphate decarboxylase CobD n=1 Tax=Albidovulum sp. TaxID=1872424 RepID=UPI001DAAE98E|nr:threonine-phosphate decarboxylase [Paracoccaceae bacterium]MCC0064366.1 threonine-phosphate decarboxylase [Defluviimonas sp.]
MRDHGGNIDGARQRFGGAREAWIDLSTGINRVPYPLPGISADAWTMLPTQTAIAGLVEVAQRRYRTRARLLPVAGAQAAIQMIPLLAPPGLARVLGPTYNEHAAALTAAGWTVETVADPDALAGADMAVLVNPNNPDGRRLTPDEIRALGPLVGRLVVDESFADPEPALSVAPDAGRGLLVLRSFGKFYGLAGLRLGFVLGGAEDIARLGEMAGPWPVSGAAIEIGRAALGDEAWAAATATRLCAEAIALDRLASCAGWRLVGGTSLFRLYETGDAAAAQERLAATQIWSRRFPWSAGWLRLGLPGPAEEWKRIEAALGH